MIWNSKGRSGIVMKKFMQMSYVFFFFKQKTAYEIRNCDWSSDVCSSDLVDTRKTSGMGFIFNWKYKDDFQG